MHFWKYLKDCTPWSFLPTFGFFSDTWVNYADWHESDLSRSLDNFLKTQPKNLQVCTRGSVTYKLQKTPLFIKISFPKLEWLGHWKAFIFTNGCTLRLHNGLEFFTPVFPKKWLINCLPISLWIFHSYVLWKYWSQLSRIIKGWWHQFG